MSYIDVEVHVSRMRECQCHPKLSCFRVQTKTNRCSRIKRRAECATFYRVSKNLINYEI